MANERYTSANMGLAKVAVQCSADIFILLLAFVLNLNFSSF